MFMLHCCKVTKWEIWMNKLSEQVTKFMKWKENTFPMGVQCTFKSFTEARYPSYFIRFTDLAVSAQGWFWHPFCVAWDEAVVKSPVKERWKAAQGLLALLGDCRWGQAVDHWTPLQPCQCPAMYFAGSDPAQTLLQGLTSGLPCHCELAQGSLDSLLVWFPESALLCSPCSEPLPEKLPPHLPCCSCW